MKTLWKILTLALSFMLLICVTACGRGDGDGDGGGGGQVTLRIESAAPLKYNYNALLKSEEEGTQIYNQALFTKQLLQGTNRSYSIAVF